MSKTIGILAVQGAFIEHEKIFNSLGLNVIELRKKEDTEKKIDALVLPGGESTVQGKLLKELQMFNRLQSLIQDGIPVFATCAGLILLSKNILNDTRKNFSALPITVKRNAYGRQLGSFSEIGNVGKTENFLQVFIRAPIIQSIEDSAVEVLSLTHNAITSVHYKNITAFAFHPELSQDNRLHKAFAEKL